MDYKNLAKDLLDIASIAGAITGQPEVTAVAHIVKGMINDDTDNKEFLSHLTDDELRQLIYSAKEELYNRREE